MTILLHPDRYNPCYPSQYIKKGVVVHDSETGDGSHDNLVAALQRPGDRPNADGTMYGSGYHAVTNGKGGYTQVADETCGPFHAPPCNYTWWAVCMPGIAAQTRADWLDTLSRAHIRGVAQFIFDRWKEQGKQFMLVGPIPPPDLVAGIGGYTSHNNVSYAWHKSTHTDPGPNFPWDILMDDLSSLAAPVTPPQEDEMAGKLIRFKNFANVFAVGCGGPPFAVGGELYDSYAADGLSKVLVNHDQTRLSIVRQAGLDPNNPNELVPLPNDPGNF